LVEIIIPVGVCVFFWFLFLDKKGKAIDGQATFRMRHFMGNNGKVFDLVVQRSSIL
jgi:hypothetical protein